MAWAAWAAGPAGCPLAATSPIRCVRYRRGARIVEEGAPADRLHTVLSGSVKLLKTTMSRRPIGIDIVGPGGPLGAECIVQGSSFVATAVALESTTCAVAPRCAVLRLLDAQPELLRELVCEASDHEASLIDRIAEVAGARVEARFAHLFLALAGKVGARVNGHTVIGLPLRRRDLADFTGTTVETTIRLMRRWQKDRIVATTGRRFVICDRAKLELLQYT